MTGLLPEGESHDVLLMETFGSLLAGGAEAESGFSPGLWEKFSALGGHVVSLPEEFGGGGGRLLDAVLVGEQAGATLAPISYADTAASARVVAPRLDDGDALRRLVSGEVIATTTRRGGAAATYAPTGAVAGWLLRFDDTSLELRGSESGPVGRPLANLGSLPMAIVDPEDATLLGRWALEPGQARRLTAERRLLEAAQLVGAGRGALELTVGHVQQRHQFGQPIGLFQAIQHRLADCATALEGAQRLVRRAAGLDGEPGGVFERACARALLMAMSAAEGAAREGLQFFGGYGFTLESAIQRYLCFVKAHVVLAADAELASHAIPSENPCFPRRPGTVPLPPAPTGAFADEVRQFTARHLTAEMVEGARASGTYHDPGFYRAMGAQGWVGAWWPPEHGGRGLAPSQLGSMWEILHYAGAPTEGQQLTENAGTAILRCGTDEQRREFLPRILRGELLVCLGYTEPDSGSDVAAARTRARRVPGGYRIEGSKIFTTMAQAADSVFLLARTDPDVPKHRGLSLFLIPMDSPGIEVHPIETLSGERTNTTFYNDVFVPEEARVGPENGGWDVLMVALEVERAAIGGFVGQARRVYDEMVAALEETDPARLRSDGVRDWLGSAAARIDAGSALCEHVYRLLAERRPVGVEAAMAKLLVTEVYKEFVYRALDYLGPAGIARDGIRSVLAGGHLEHAFRHAQVATIYGGTSEIQRGIVAGRGLGLRAKR